MVKVKLNNGFEYKGILEQLDGNLNLILKQCEEYENEVMLNKFNTVLVRGNNIFYIEQWCINISTKLMIKLNR